MTVQTRSKTSAMSWLAKLHLAFTGTRANDSAREPSAALGPHHVGPDLGELSRRGTCAFLFTGKEQPETESRSTNTRQCRDFGDERAGDNGVVVLAENILDAGGLRGEFARFGSKRRGGRIAEVTHV